MNRFSSLMRLRKNIYLPKKYVTSGKSVQQPALTINDMPHPRSLPIIGTKLDLLLAGGGKKLHEYIDGRHKVLGPTFYENLSGPKIVFICNPVAMKELFLKLEGKHPTHLLPESWILYGKLYGNKRGLFFMDGKEWLDNRRVMNMHLLKEDSEKSMEGPVQEVAENFIKSWKDKAHNGCFSPNLESDLYRFSIDVIVSILLGNRLNQRPNKHSDMILNMFSEAVKKIFQTTTNLNGLPLELCQRLNTKAWRNFKESVDASLILAQKIATEMLQNVNENNGLIKRLHEDKLSDDTIIRIIADFVIAAGDTTAFTTMWILYLLSKNNDVTTELRASDKSHVKYIIKEAMRLYPVAPFLSRILPKENIVDKKYKLEKGTPIVASIYTSGRDEQNFSQADKFLPYRWDRNDPRRDALLNYEPSASLPFALGARSCIGRKIAMLQMTELVYQIVTNFDLKCLNKTEVKPIAIQVLVPNTEVKIEVSLRKPEIKEN